MTTNSQSPHGNYAAPVLWGIMADSDVGKTWDELNTWRYKAEYDGDEATIRRVAGSMDLDQSKLRVFNRPTLRATIKRLKTYKSRFPDKGVPLTQRPIWAMVVDDASLKLEADRQDIWEAESKNHFARWDRVNELIVDLHKAQREGDVHVHASFHYDAYRPKNVDDKGKVHPARKGGAAVLGVKASKLLTHYFDVVALAGEDLGRWPRPTAFLGKPPNSKHHTKDRHNFLRDVRPLCTREILLHLGYTIPPVDPWEAALTEKFAELAGKVGPMDYGEVRAAFKGPYHKLAAKYGKALAYLPLYNGLARAQVRSGLSYYDDIFTGAGGF